MPHRIIDCHSHANWHGHDVDALVANMDEHGIEKAWVLTWEMAEQDWHSVTYYHESLDPRATGSGLTLEKGVEALKKYPDRFIGGWAPDPRDMHARARLKAAVDLHGIKVYGELKCRMRFDSIDAISMYRYCAELGLPVLFHLEGPAYRLEEQCENFKNWVEWYGGGISVVDNMCRLCPDTIFIGHGPGFWREISGDANAPESTKGYPDGPVMPNGQVPELMRKYNNLYADISADSGRCALGRDMEQAKKFVDEFQDRILFGRDQFDGRHIEVLDRLELNEEILEKVLYKTAERLLGEK